MASLLHKYIDREEYESYEDFSKNFHINVPEDFNFAYDIVDVYAKEQPDKVALSWCDEETEKVFTFKDLKYFSDKAANFFSSLGITKGDRVLLTLIIGIIVVIGYGVCMGVAYYKKRWCNLSLRVILISLVAIIVFGGSLHTIMQINLVLLLIIIKVVYMIVLSCLDD